MVIVATMQNFPWDWWKLKQLKNISAYKILCIHEINTETLCNPVLKYFDAFNVVHGEMVPLLRKRLIKSSHLRGKPIFTLPYMVCEEYDQEKYFNPYYVVPGRIEKFRRDYSLLEGIEPLCFLGRPIGRYGRSVLHLADKTYDGYVEQDEYDDMLRGCRGIIAPLRNPTKGTNRFTREYYGTTKSCGAYWEAVRFRKPFVSNVPFDINYDGYTLTKWRDYFDEKVLSVLLDGADLPRSRSSI